MKIPETSANIGAYYGNEDNGQWQPNGVIIDNGVGGGVVGSGDAGVHRPPVYPVHIPRGHIPGYVMAGAYYPPPAYPQAQPAPQDDFADYMWMENEEEFDKQVMQQLEEEALMEQCIEAMLEDEQRERHRPVSNGHNNHMPTTSNGQGTLSLEETVSRSTLNPLAAEFVPTRALPPTPTTTPATEEKKEQSTDGQTEDAPSVEVTPQEQVDSKEEVAPSQTGVPTPTPSETPEVSAADVEPVAEKQPKETRKTEPKKTPKQEPKVKAKPAVVKSDTKVPLKKKEVKAAKSETRVEEKIEEAVAAVADVAKQSQQPVGEEATGVKPINYAAAARANKPKKPSTPPATDKQQPKEKVEKKEKVPIKEKPKTDKTSIQRKNSMK